MSYYFDWKESGQENGDSVDCNSTDSAFCDRCGIAIADRAWIGFVIDPCTSAEGPVGVVRKHDQSHRSAVMPVYILLTDECRWGNGS
jgi:hypothetical protein